ncbi:MAG: TetR/AcrR family transcriptional regulator [Oscillospiraceae bacterium]|nr:TetR/AcrR family transcriptional regulator [Oscillospiraceae bacterium]
MYHIKQDKRAKASVELICAGLMDCLSQKNFADITISDIQRSSTVSRSTFYRNFDCLEDVLSLMCDRVFEDAFSSDSGEMRQEVFSAWFKNKKLIETIVQINRGDLLFESLRRSAVKFGRFPRLEQGSELYNYLISIIASTMMGIIVTWVESGKKEDEAELKSVIGQCFAALIAFGIV